MRINLLIVLILVSNGFKAYGQKQGVFISATSEKEMTFTMYYSFHDSEDNGYPFSESRRVNKVGKAGHNNITLSVNNPNLIKMFRIDFGSNMGVVIIDSIKYFNKENEIIWNGDHILKEFNLHEIDDWNLRNDNSIELFSTKNDPFIVKDLTKQNNIYNNQLDSINNSKVTIELSSKKSIITTLYYNSNQKTGFQYQERNKIHEVLKENTDENLVFYLPNNDRLTNFRVDFGSKPNNKISLKRITYTFNGLDRVWDASNIEREFVINSDIEEILQIGNVLDITTISTRSSIDPFIYYPSRIEFPSEILKKKVQFLIKILVVAILLTFINRFLFGEVKILSSLELLEDPIKSKINE